MTLYVLHSICNAKSKYPDVFYREWSLTSYNIYLHRNYNLPARHNFKQQWKIWYVNNKQYKNMIY